jgi:hypothetical protein
LTVVVTVVVGTGVLAVVLTVVVGTEVGTVVVTGAAGFRVIFGTVVTESLSTVTGSGAV